MNLVELYKQTPVEKHKDIKVIGNRVFVKDTEEDVQEFLISEVGELWLIHSEKTLASQINTLKADIEAIKIKLGVILK